MQQSTQHETPTRIVSPHGAALGVVCRPHRTLSPYNIGVVFVPGGFQYRAGAHRQTVRLARQLASNGIPSLRFDLAGLGDATGEMHAFEDISPQILAASDTLTKELPEIRHIVLWGLCDGASAALLHWEATRDARIAGLALLNPWVRSEASLARAHVRHYYLKRLANKAFWQKLLTGGVGFNAVGALLNNLRAARTTEAAPQASFQKRMAKTCLEFSGETLVLISESDITGQEFLNTLKHDPLWAGCLARKNIRLVSLPYADHTCAAPAADQALQNAVITWIKSIKTIK